MNTELYFLVEARVKADGLGDGLVGGAILSACDGRDALERYLGEGELRSVASSATQAARPSETYLTSVKVEGFRGIGPAQELNFSAGPGLTLVIGRNGSGKSSFAEALEVLFTGESKRWADRPKIWAQGWRNFHQPHPTRIAADLLLSGFGPTRVSAAWQQDGALNAPTVVVQPKGKPKATLEAIGWHTALVSYRPFLSYNELGSLLDEGPSKLYDALSVVLGLEDLVTAQGALTKARTDRQRARRDADEQRKLLIEELEELNERDADERLSLSITALRSKGWGIDELDQLLSGESVRAGDSLLSALQQTGSLDFPDAAYIRLLLDRLNKAIDTLKALTGTDADRARELVDLLEAALGFHEDHPEPDCPVCGTSGALGTGWTGATRKRLLELRDRAHQSEQAHKGVAAVHRDAVSALQAPPPKALKQMSKAGIGGANSASEAWSVWNEGADLKELAALAAHIERNHPRLLDAVSLLQENAAKELKRRQDRWRPAATAIGAWIPQAREALLGAKTERVIGEADEWLKKASAEIRNERFAPIADEAMETWRLLRQNSSVELGRVQLVGAGNSRRVSLDVTVDGQEGSALGVMSQGELHSLALSLFLPRATLRESPFRFVVIDDPVQSMDPARVDGLARVLERVAATRQVVVFTHDDRLPEAVRRLAIKATTLTVTRRPKSVVEVRVALDPVSAHIDDAQALVHTADLPRDVLKRVVPGHCRAALEAAFMEVIRRRRLAAGQPHDEVEQELQAAGKLTSLAALALFDAKDRGGDVMKRLNQFGSWAGDVFKQVNAGAHGETTADIGDLTRDTERLIGHIRELK